MKKVELTMVKNITTRSGESEAKIVAIGYDEANAKLDAISTLKYACCMDFNSPSSCRPGIEIQYFSAFGIEVEKDTDEDEFADKMNWEQAIIMEHDGRYYALPENYDEWRTGGALISDEVRQLNDWDSI